MITYLTGDLLESDAQCLVNTVNCEGYMGKGIAYQFKLVYPKNNQSYVRACKSGDLKIGKVHHFSEDGKIIVNFPTKDKWREKSKMEYIESGLDDLIVLINELSIQSIAIPPLGSGNGGLIWKNVRQLIEQKMHIISKDIDISIYEPSNNYVAKSTAEPKLTLSALVLMLIKKNLSKFGKIRLQKTAFFFNIFSESTYFSFKKAQYGPYDYSIDVVSKSIREFQRYHNVKSTAEAYEIAYKKLVSKSVDDKLMLFKPYIELAARYSNQIESNQQLECIATILYLIEENKILNQDEIIRDFRLWSKNKSGRFTDADIIEGINYLYNTNVIEHSLLGYHITNHNSINHIAL